MSAYEIGKHYPSAKSLIRMSELFDASIDYILGLSPLRKVILEKGLPNDEVRLLSLYRHLDATQKEKSRRFLELLKQTAEPLANFDEKLWQASVESVTVRSKDDITVSFISGTEIVAGIEKEGR